MGRTEVDGLELVRGPVGDRRELIDELHPRRARRMARVHDRARLLDRVDADRHDVRGGPGQRVDGVDLAAEHGHDAQRREQRRAHTVTRPVEVDLGDLQLGDALAAQQLAGGELLLHRPQRVDAGARVVPRPDAA